MLTKTLFLFLFALPLPAADEAPLGNCWLRDGAAPSPPGAYLICEQGPLLSSADGVKWTVRPTGATAEVRVLKFLDAQRGFLAGNGGMLRATTDGGRTWTAVKTGTEAAITSLAFVGEAGWAAGYDGLILHTADGGRTWTPQAAGLSTTLEGIYFVGAQTGWAVGWVGTILRTVNGGQTWQNVRSPAAAWSLNSVYFRDARNGWAVGFEGQILRSTDGGETWAAQPSPLRSWLTSVTFDAGNRGWIASDEGLLTSTDGGETWRLEGERERLFLNRLVPVKDTVWAVGPFGISQGGGARMAWKPIEEILNPGSSRPAEQPVSGMIPDSSTQLTR
jgi:photosystem II stability/assembly factor-like uncharacterized protein